jgi:hypothetical protein
MCPDRERRSSAEAAPEAGEGVRPGIDRPAAVAAISGFVLYEAVYTLVFALSGFAVPVAIRAAIANGVPDGLLALGAFAASRRIDATRAPARRLLRAHALPACLLVALAFGGKTLLLFLEMVLFRREGTFRVAAGIAVWQLFLSALAYLAVAATSHAWLIARRLRDEEARSTRAEALRAGAQLSALRAQLNPHFLFNTLHSVLGMVRRDPALAESALENLGDLLRYALRVHRDGVDRTPLRREWEFMETYLDLESIRLGDRLRVSRSADEAAMDVDVPTFSLQPLVENAVRHGIAPRAAGGRIDVAARLDGGELRLEVGNDGGGAADGAADGDEGGVGLRVLRDRLEVLYGGRALMTAGPTAEGGYRVVLAIPADPPGAEADG